MDSDSETRSKSLVWPSQNVSNTNRNGRPISENTTGKRCNRTISKHTGSAHKSPIRQIKTRWHNETCVQSEENEQKCEVRTFQNRGNASSSRPVKTKRLVDENLSQICLLCSEHCACIPQVLEIPMERENLGLQSSTIRAGFSSSSVHKNSETSNGTADESRSEDTG